MATPSPLGRPNQVLMTEEHSSSCAWTGCSERWLLGWVQFSVQSAHVTKASPKTHLVDDRVPGKGRASPGPDPGLKNAHFPTVPLWVRMWVRQTCPALATTDWAVGSRPKKRCGLPGIATLQFLQE